MTPPILGGGVKRREEERLRKNVSKKLFVQQGDSGSSLMCDGLLEGVVSYGMGCGIVQLPGVYTRVALHRDWIHSIISINK